MSTSRLPVVMTPTLLNALRTNPRLPPHTWYFVSAVTLSALNRPDEISKVFTSALEHHKTDGPASISGAGTRVNTEHLQIARRMRESLVKSAAIVGLPKTINALLALKASTPEHLQDAPMAASPTQRAIEFASTPSSALLHRGETFFARVYGKVAARVMGQMDRSGTEDLGLTARLMYGYLLSNVSVLNAVESSWVLIAGLVPQDVNPQLKGHLRGALNNGATVEQVRAVRSAVISICTSAGMACVGTTETVAPSMGWREAVANL